MASLLTSTLEPASPRSGIAGPWPAPSADLELREILIILRRRKLIILLALMMGIGLAALSISVAHQEYSSTATIEVNKDHANTLGLNDLSGASAETGGTVDQLNSDLLTQQAVITSDNIALRVIQRLKLDTVAPYAIPPDKNGSPSPLGMERGLPLENAPLQLDRVLGMFRSRLSVKLVKGTRLITITYTDPDAHRSTLIANAIVDAFMTDYTQARYQASAQASTWLENQLSALKNRVTESQAKVDKYQQASGLVGMTVLPVPGKPGEASTVAPASNTIPLDRLVELNRDLTSVDELRLAREAVYRMTQTQDPDVVLGVGSTALGDKLGSGSVLSPGSADLGLLQQLRQQQAQLHQQLATATTKYGAKNPVIQQLRNEEATQNDQIRTEMNRIRAQTKNDFNMAVLAESALRKRISSQEQEVNQTSAKAEQLLLLQQEAFSSRQLYQDLYSKLQEANIAAGVSAPKITLVDSGRIPVRPSSPKTMTRLELGGALGLVLGLIVGWIWDYFDDSITSVDQIAQITPLRVIGVIPGFPKRPELATRVGARSIGEVSRNNPNAWMIHAPQSYVSEAYRTLRTALVVSKENRPAKVVAVLSGCPQEGKSITCFNTAAAFAIQGARVLYLDADLRRPGEGRIVDWPDVAGTSEYLKGRKPLSETIHPFAKINNLYVMPAGAIPRNPAELIGSRRFAALLQDLKTEFDYIFIDTPPLLLVTDGELLTSMTDGYLFVLRAGKTTKPMLRRSLSLLASSSAPALGIVLNDVNTRSADYPLYGGQRKASTYYAADTRLQA